MRRTRFSMLQIDPLAVAVLLGLLFTERIGTVCALALAVALHEAGHFAAARLLRVKVARFRFGLLGARIEVGGMLSYGREALLAAAGPAASFLGAGAAAFAMGRCGFLREFCAVSLLLGTLNLLPVRTFDGGRMAFCLLSRLRGEEIAESVLQKSSFCFLTLLWCLSVYFLLRAGSGISWLGFSVSLLLRFFDGKT